jgi:hypothetical protein
MSINEKQSEDFRVDIDDALVRSVVPIRGKPYEHRCTMWAFKRVCWTFTTSDKATTIESIAAEAQIPLTQAATALAFLRERGCVVFERKRNYAASRDVYLDGMTEYHALGENASID